LDVTLKLSEVDNKQYSKYKSISNSTLKEYKNETHLLHKMKEFSDMALTKRDIELNKVKKTYIQLDNSLIKAREDLKEVDKVIEKKSNKGNEMKKEVNEIANKNSIIKEEIKQIR